MASSPAGIVDTPSQHGMFMLGRTHLFLCHMPMFTMEDHSYQLILRADLDPASAKIVATDRSSHAHTPYNLINIEDDQFTLPAVHAGDITSFRAHVYRSYAGGDGAPGDKIVDAAVVTIRRVVVYRHFDQSMQRPPHSTYYLFGEGGEAHLSHRLSRDPDFQHLLSVSAPDWLDATQLRAGVTIAFKDLIDTPVPCADPVTAGTHAVFYEGNETLQVDVVIPPESTVWFSTANLLNSTDPCAAT